MDHVFLFARRWLANPLAIGAIVPSGRALADAMAAQVPPGDGAVLEFGGGTGSMTRALLRRVEPASLFVFERDPDLCRVLRLRFPELRLFEGDVSEALTRLPAADRGRARAVVSGLPLLSMPPARRRPILAGAVAALAGDGVFVQFTYGLASPVPRRELAALGLQASRAAFTWLNLPPATVWLFRRAPTTATSEIRDRDSDPR